MANNHSNTEKKPRPSLPKHLGMIAVGCAIGYLLSRFLIADPVLIIFATIVGGMLGSGAAYGHPSIEFGNDGTSGGGDSDGGDGGGD